MEKYYLLGKGIKNSPSGYLHGLLFAYSGHQADYECLDVAENDFEVTLDRLLANENTRGINATIPYKTAFAARFKDKADESVLRYYSANTYSATSDKLYNTDVCGFKQAVSALGARLDGRVAICGTGATGLMAGLAVAEAGGRITYVFDKNRKVDKAGVISIIHAVFPNVVVDFDTNDAVFDSDLLVNATPLGNSVYPYICPVCDGIIKHTKSVLDLNYYPDKSLLLRKAQAYNVPCSNGLAMLVYQAAAAHGIWYGAHFTDEALSEVINKTAEHLNSGSLKNHCVAVCGFMAAGKTTLAKSLASALLLDFIDTDQLITARYGNIPELFNSLGEDGFRALEAEVISSLKNQKYAVIALGGGALTLEENRRVISSFGRVCFVDTPFDVCLSRARGNGRPLADSLSDAKLYKLYLKRRPLYVSCADVFATDHEDANDVLIKLSSLNTHCN